MIGLGEIEGMVIVRKNIHQKPPGFCVAAPEAKNTAIIGNGGFIGSFSDDNA
jgi:hypothetical protein